MKNKVLTDALLAVCLLGSRSSQEKVSADF